MGKLSRIVSYFGGKENYLKTVHELAQTIYKEKRVIMSNVGSFVKRFRGVMRNDAGVNGDAQRIEQIAWILFPKSTASKSNAWELTEENYRSIMPEQCRWRNWALIRTEKLTGDTP